MKLLVHLCQRLASYTLATFPVRLSIGEEDGSVCQSSLLQHPSGFIEQAFKNMCFEIVHKSTYIQRLAALVEGQEIIFLPRSQEPILLPLRATRSKHTVRRTENVLHTRSFLGKIAIWALDDGDGVNPVVS